MCHGLTISRPTRPLCWPPISSKTLDTLLSVGRMGFLGAGPGRCRHECRPIGAPQQPRGGCRRKRPQRTTAQPHLNLQRTVQNTGALAATTATKATATAYPAEATSGNSDLRGSLQGRTDFSYARGHYQPGATLLRHRRVVRPPTSPLVERPPL